MLPDSCTNTILSSLLCSRDWHHRLTRYGNIMWHVLLAGFNVESWEHNSKDPDTGSSSMDTASSFTWIVWFTARYLPIQLSHSRFCVCPTISVLSNRASAWIQALMVWDPLHTGLHDFSKNRKFSLVFISFRDRNFAWNQTFSTNHYTGPVNLWKYSTWSHIRTKR